jgi:predicted GNAT family acetyltransferase
MRAKEFLIENKNHSAVAELRAALLAKKDQLQSATDDDVYAIIDRMMTGIARSHNISGKKLHDLWVDQYGQIPDKWIMQEDAVNTADIELRHEPTSTGGVEIHAYRNGQEIGWVRFSKLKTGQVKAAMVHVPERLRRQGIGTAMYRYARQELGLNIVPSDTQTEHGRAFWNKVHEDREFVTERKKRRRRSRSFGSYWYPGYGYYGSGAYGGDSGGGGDGGGGGESVTEAKNSKVLFIGNDTAIVGQEHGKQLQLSDLDAERVRAIAERHGAWYEGNGMDRKLTAGIIDEYAGSWDNDLLSPAIKGYPAPFLYVLFSNIKENDTVEGKIGSDPDSTIFDRILDTQPSTNYFPDRQFDAETLEKFLRAVSEGEYDFVQMSQAPATEQNVRRFFTLGERLMFPDNWAEYPYRAGRVAKSVNDLRDRFLATRKQGVYVAGSDHLQAVQQFLDQNKQDVKEAVIGSDDLVDVYIRGQHKGETITRLVARAFPNKNIPLLIRKLETKHGVNPNAVVYGPSRIQNENFADGKVKGKSRPGRVKRAGASCAGSVTSLRQKAKKTGGERAKMYHWCANMKSGRKK